MRTNIEIDKHLMDEALQTTGLKSKREAVDLALRTLVRLQRQKARREFRGRLAWQGGLDAMRRDC